jgi:hypothetical protein
MADNAASKRPSNSKFKQQKLPAWKPVLTPSSVLPTFFGIGALFIIIGSILLAQTDDVVEKELEYTDCARTSHVNPNPSDSGLGGTCGDLLENDANYTDTDALHNRCECILTVKLEGFEDKETFIYYAFENYYQNHRRYVKSRSDAQLRSAQVMGNDECDPLESKDGKYYAPCGLIANSLFNDTIELLTNLGQQTSRDGEDLDAPTVTATGTFVAGYTGSDISWNSDRDVKFKNPCEGDGCDLCGPDGLNGTDSLKPPNWPVDACKLGETITHCGSQCNSESGPDSDCTYNPHSSCFQSSGLGYQNEDFIVWMRTAALPTFRKLYRRVPKGFKDGTYYIRIGYNYPVKNFGGIKKIFISTTSSIGGKSWFLPSMYLVVGILSFLAGASFLVMQHFFKISRKLGDVSNLAWHSR